MGSESVCECARGLDRDNNLNAGSMRGAAVSLRVSRSPADGNNDESPASWSILSKLRPRSSKWITNTSLLGFRANVDGERVSRTCRSASPKTFARIVQDAESRWSSEQS